MSSDDEEATQIIASDLGVKVVYCGACTMPHEYCEYSNCYEKCKSMRPTSAAGIVTMLPNIGIVDVVE